MEKQKSNSSQIARKKINVLLISVEVITIFASVQNLFFMVTNVATILQIKLPVPKF